ncbi:SDR family oxidoreductase [Burkholderia pyrrocinia]|uniref:SDR family oxidoreductase n=1 Tax=Burkholderia pyrrocinia TaxID=60550 RepID=UPI001FC8372A|nr:SDR family oxidoreductase [Burkholderia pyrrocinia]
MAKWWCEGRARAAPAGLQALDGTDSCGHREAARRHRLSSALPPDNARCSIPSGVAHLSRAMRPHSCTRAARRHVGRFCEITSSALDETQKMLALKRWRKAHDVGRAAVFLASDRADYITGQQLNVSGGYGL